jgi:hypothetical protein
MTAKIKPKQIKGSLGGEKPFRFIPEGLYWFHGGWATPMKNKTILADDGTGYQLPKDWFQKIVNSL